MENYASKCSETAAEISGLVQSIGYFLAAIGVFVVGLIQDLTKDWNYSLGLMALIACYKLTVGLQAGRHRKCNSFILMSLGESL